MQVQGSAVSGPHQSVAALTAPGICKHLPNPPPLPLPHNVFQPLRAHLAARLYTYAEITPCSAILNDSLVLWRCAGWAVPRLPLRVQSVMINFRHLHILSCQMSLLHYSQGHPRCYNLRLHQPSLVFSRTSWHAILIQGYGATLFLHQLWTP